ncbi:ABC transporter permease subunit, partial [Candidatus Sumerlaeota bacterium]|nr:ABC transporter permease subunit [Candidatus Sumerlaeota bacterium]
LKDDRITPRTGVARLWSDLVALYLQGRAAGFGIFRAASRAAMGAGHLSQSRGPIRALIAKEVRTMMRTRKSRALLLALTGSVAAVFLIFWNNNAMKVTFASRSAFSRNMFTTLYLVQFCALGLISPVMTAAVVTTERENRTLDLLYVSGFTRMEILFSKWFATIIYQIVLVAALLPVIALTFQLGGVGVDEYLAALVMIVVGVSTYGMIGMAYSAHLRKTTTSLAASIITVLILAYFVPLHRIFSSNSMGISMLYSPSFIFTIMVMTGVFAFAALVAWIGLSKPESARVMIAPKIIDDAAVLQRRRKRWPYYLIDPLARAHEIKDRQNPVWVKEQRVGFLAKTPVLIRLTYVGMFISLMLTIYTNLEGTFKAISEVAQWATTFIMLLVPILAATGISKEREEDTLDLLRVTLLAPRSIVWAKFLISLRFVLALGLSMMLIPFLVYFGAGFYNMGGAEDLYGRRVHLAWTDPLINVIKMVPFILAYAILYSSLAIFCSSLCRRNLSAILAGYAAMILLTGSPYLIRFGLDLFAGGNAAAAEWAWPVSLTFESMRWYLCPVFSPYFYFSSETGGSAAHAFSQPEDWAQIGQHFLLIAGISWVFVELAARGIRLNLSK